MSISIDTFYGDSRYESISSNTTLPFGIARVYVYEPTTGSLKVSLPDPNTIVPNGGPVAFLVNESATITYAVHDENDISLGDVSTESTRKLVISLKSDGTKEWILGPNYARASVADAQNPNPSTFWKDTELNSYNGNLIHLWPMDMVSGNATDVVGSTDLTSVGSGKVYEEEGVTPVDGDTSVRITQDQGGFEESSFATLPDTDFTISVWAKSAQAANRDLFQWIVSSTVVGQYRFENDVHRMSVGNPTPTLVTRSSISSTPDYPFYEGFPTTKSTLDWNHYVLVREPDDGFTHYVNGVPLVASIDTNDSLAIGSDTFNVGNNTASNGFLGWVQQISLWDTQISSDAIFNLWNGGVFRKYNP